MWNNKSALPSLVKITRAANEGLCRQELLQKTVHALAADGRADRVGIWLKLEETDYSEGREAQSFRGYVWDRESECVPVEWRRLTPRAPLPPMLLCTRQSVEQELEHGALPMIGPLLDMRRAVWVPVEHRGRLQGVMLAGSRSKHGDIPRDLFESAASQLALAIEIEEEQRHSADQQTDLAVVTRTLEGFAATNQPEKALWDLVDSCTTDSQAGGGLGARFAVIGVLPGKPNVPGETQQIDFGWKSGDSVWTRAVECSAASKIWRQAVETRRLASNLPDEGVSRSSVAEGAMIIVAIPLESEGTLHGVLVAGFAREAAPQTRIDRLKLRGALAAAVLGKWKTNQLEARSSAGRKALLDNSREATVLLDESGRIAMLSTRAQLLLREDAGSASEYSCAGQTLMDLFQPAERAGVKDWWEGAFRNSAERHANHQTTLPVTHGVERRKDPQPLTEAILNNGVKVRLKAPLTEAILNNGVKVRLKAPLPAGGAYAAVVLETWRDPVASEGDNRAATELASVLEWLDEGVVLFDALDNVRALNSRFLSMTGLQDRDRTELSTLEKLIFNLSEHVEEPWNFAQRWRNLARGIDGGIREELELVRPSVRVVQRKSRPILDGHGRRLGRVEIYRDLTDRRGSQSQLLRTGKLAALGQLIIGIAHELNNPLTSILGHSQRLLQSLPEAGNTEEIRQIRNIFEEAERATAILRQLLVNAHESKPQLRSVAINQLVLEAIELQHGKLTHENIRVEMDLDESFPSVHGDAGRLQQLLLNLMGNARQALEQTGRGGTIRMRTKQIGKQRVLLEVADDGPGIPAENLGRIFDPFFTTKPAGSGTGLGLAIVSDIVREHGGHVNVSNSPNGGAIFSIALCAADHISRTEKPLGNQRRELIMATADLTAASISNVTTTLRSSETIKDKPISETSRLLRFYTGGLLIPGGELLAAGLASGTAPLPDARSNRILVVEDEPTVARLIADVLKDEGFFVDVLLDGHEALQQAARATYDLVICDMKMPGLDGQHFYKALVRDGNVLSRRFLFVTGDVVSQHTHQFLKVHALPHVAKPFRVEELKEKVHALLDRSSIRNTRAMNASKNP